MTASLANAQQVVTSELTFRNNLAQVELVIDLNDANIKPRAFILIVPVIMAEDGEFKELPPVLVNGRVRHRVYLRMLRLNRAPIGIGMVIDAGNTRGSLRHTYTATVPHESWMNAATVVIHEEMCNCHGEMETLTAAVREEPIQEEPIEEEPIQEEPIEEEPIEEEPIQEVAPPVITPVINYRSEVIMVYIDFYTDEHVIVPDFGNNRAELAKINQKIESVRNNPAYTNIAIKVDGFASIDGVYHSNLALSERRANSIKNYIRDQYAFPENIFTVRGHGEDWATLTRLLEESDLPYRDEVLNIIRTVDLFAGRKSELMRLQNGNPYRHMLTNLFPQLRRVEIEIQYTVRN